LPAHRYQKERLGLTTGTADGEVLFLDGADRAGSEPGAALGFVEAQNEPFVWQPRCELCASVLGTQPKVDRSARADPHLGV
jgi:hypothetical protein